MATTSSLDTPDYACIGIYFVACLAVGFWSTFRGKKDNAVGYFLAGKSMHWIPVGASIYASNIGAPKFVGLAGSAASYGFAVAIYEWHAIYLLIALGWIFVPVYVASGAFTMPEYLKKRFGGSRLRIYLSVQALCIYVLTRITSELFSGAIFIQQLLGWNIYACIAVILAITALYTTAGGLVAVIYTDTMQTVVILIGAAILFGISMVDLGGWNEFMTKYPMSSPKDVWLNPDNYSCGVPREDFMHVWRGPEDGHLPWPGAAIGLTTIGLWVWCADQLTVQRCLSAKNMSHGKAGALLAAFLKIFSFFLWIVPGMASRIFYPDEIACADPDVCENVCGNRAGCTNIAYPLMVLRKMPAGARGLMLAAMLAALMSTLTSIFNSASSMFTMDIWRRIRRHAPQSELMIVGRVCVLILVVLSMVWIPVMMTSQGGELWAYVQTIASCLTPPWCWVFLLALFWKRTTEPGAFYGLLISVGCGVTRLILEFSYDKPKCGTTEPDPRPAVLSKVHFLHFAIILSVVSIVSTVVISLMTAPRPPEKLRKVTWWTRHDKQDPEETESEDDFGLEDEDNDYDPRMQKQARRVPKKPSLMRRVVNDWLCGLSSKPKPRLTKEQKMEVKRRMTDISESPSMRIMTTLAAVALAIGTTFLLTFFG